MKEAHPPELSCYITSTQTLWTFLRVSTLFTAAKQNQCGSQRWFSYLMCLFPLEFSGKVKQFSVAAVVSLTIALYHQAEFCSLLCRLTNCMAFNGTFSLSVPQLPYVWRENLWISEALVTANVTWLLPCSYLSAPAFFQKTHGQISHHVIWSGWHLSGLTYWATVEEPA